MRNAVWSMQQFTGAFVPFFCLPGLLETAAVYWAPIKTQRIYGPCSPSVAQNNAQGKPGFEVTIPGRGKAE